MMDRVNGYFSSIRGLTKKKSLHSIEDLEELIKFHKETLDGAAKSNFLLPYQRIAQSIHEILVGTRNTMFDCLKDYSKRRAEQPGKSITYMLTMDMDFSGNIFRFELSEKELPKVIEVLNNGIPVMEEKAAYFGHMKDSLEKHIQLEVMPNDIFDGERIYLARGNIIVPSGLNPTGYYVFRISTKRKNGDDLLHYERVNPHPSSSVEEAIKRYTDPDVIGTLAVAKSTEFYPLMETALPIIREKYENGLKSQDS